MRVLHIYGGNLYGGVERMLTTFARFAGLAPEMEQRFALCYRGRLSEELEALGEPVHWLGEVRASRPWQVQRARRQLRNWLKQEPCEVALCHSWWPYAVFGPAARAAGVPVALWAHSLADGREWVQWWAKRRRPDLLLTNSPHVASTLEWMYPGMEARLMGTPVPPPVRVNAVARQGIRAGLNTPLESTVILQVSRMEALKGHHLFLNALARLRDQPPWVAWIAGGAQRPEEQTYLRGLRAQAQQLGLEPQLRWLGERRDVDQLMGAADIFCQPNTEPEPFGIVFVEALAAGLPVVTSAAGGGLDIVTPACGRLAPADRDAIGGALQELVDNPELRQRLAAAAPARARMLGDPATRMQRLQQVLAEVAR